MGFASDIYKWINKVERRADITMRGTAYNLSQTLFDNTPVSTGKLLGSWTPGINSTNTNEYSGGPSAWHKNATGNFVKDDTIAAANRAKAMNHLEPIVSAITSMLEYDDNYILANSVSYGPQAEHEGWKHTGPYFMVENTAATFRMLVQENLNKAKGLA